MSRRPATTVIFAGFFLLGMLFILWGILLPDISRDLSMSEVISGALFSLFSLGMMTGAILGGKYATRFDFLFLLASLLTINTILLLILSALTQWQWFLAMVFIIGVISSSMITIGHTMIAQMFAEQRFAMMGVMDCMLNMKI